MHEMTGRERLLAALIALTGGFALALRLYLTLQGAVASGQGIASGLVSYFGFLTEWTNLLVLLSVVCPLLLPASAAGRFFMRKEVMGWVTASILFVGIAYFLLLSQNAPKDGPAWLANVLLHYAVPVLMAIYGLVRLRGASLRWVMPWWWSLYLIIYFIYALVRGALIDSYPYGFINAAKLGYEVTLRNGALLLLAFVVLSYALLLICRLGARVRAS